MRKTTYGRTLRALARGPERHVGMWNSNGRGPFASCMCAMRPYKVCSCRIFHAHTGVAARCSQIGPIVEPCNYQRFQRVNAESVQLSAISRPYWGGCKVLSDWSDHTPTYNCRRFQRVNAESVQLSPISRSYWGGWRRPDFGPSIGII